MENTKEEAVFKKILDVIGVSNSKIDKDKYPIEVISYTKKFRRFKACENINFKANFGSIHGFIGPNGSGKTTTIKAMIGAYIPSKGKILINGHKAGSVKANKLIGYIPERASFPKHLNTIAYLKAMGELSGLKSAESKKRAIGILKALNMEKQAKRKPINFSSGMQKKILLAQALLTDPKILILDEPASNLDPTTRKELFDQLIFLRNQGKTILISSHILSELERIIDEATFIYYGEVVWTGSVDEFHHKSSDVFIKSEDNEKLANFLRNYSYKIAGDPKTEIVIKNLPSLEIQKLLEKISSYTVKIFTFRANDLQSIYDRLSHQAFLKNKGKQTLRGKSTVKNEKGSN